MADAGESDEAYARRLQQLELGVVPVAPVAPDATTPLMADFNGPTDVRRNPTVINTRLNELYAGRAAVLAGSDSFLVVIVIEYNAEYLTYLVSVVVVTNMPQVLATAVVLSTHWSDPDVCSPAYTNRWIAWSLTSSLRMLLYTSVVLYLHVCKAWLEERQDTLAKTLSLRNFLDAIGLVWFVVGNLWLFGDDAEQCAHPEKSVIYLLCYAMLVVSYLQICMPCILLIIFLPILCFCMPCLIRILARLQDIHAAKGANEAAIDSLNLTSLSEEHLRSVDNNTCPICINEMVVGEQARYLPCRHLFHKTCVDEWLRVNASCPTCRASIFTLGQNPDPHLGADLLAAARGSNEPRATA